MFSVYSGLLSLQARLWRVLNALDGSDTAPQTTEQLDPLDVIEANPLCVSLLCPPSPDWRFQGNVPDLYASAKSRQWYVNKTVVQSTGAQDAQPAPDGEDLSLPTGLWLWQSTMTAQRLLLMARHDLDRLFARETALPMPERFPAHDDLCMAGKYCLFETCADAKILYQDARVLLEREFPYLVRLCDEYARTAARIYRMSVPLFRETTHLCIEQMRRGTPLSMHGVVQFDHGPVVTVLLGEPEMHYDMAPVLLKGRQPLRLTLREGTCVVQDGRARMLWAYGVPDRHGERPHYALTFRMHQGRAVAVTWDPVLRTDILETPIESTAVFTSKKIPALPGHDYRQQDACYPLIQEISARIRISESRALTRRFKAFNHPQHDGTRGSIPRPTACETTDPSGPRPPRAR
jgi:hypothetical protein